MPTATFRHTPRTVPSGGMYANGAHSTPTIPVIDSVVSNGTATTPNSATGTIKTLNSLYKRATKSFLNRDIVDAYALLAEGISILALSPAGAGLTTKDYSMVSTHRKKWDILRITIETTVYASPSKTHAHGTSPSVLPEPLQTLLLQSPHSLIQSSYKRSQEFFPLQPLPGQVLLTLVYSSLKLDCASFGRVMVEDWLGSRVNPAENRSPHNIDGTGESEMDSAEQYRKVLDVYMLKVLPALDEWDYAREFLEYETELEPPVRDRLKSTLSRQHAGMLATRLPRPSASSPSSSSLARESSSQTSTPRRPLSPAPSTSSTSSSLSTTSTHTIVPATPRGMRSLNGHAVATMTPSTSNSRARSKHRSSGSDTSVGTITNGFGNGHARHQPRTDGVVPSRRSPSKTLSSSRSSSKKSVSQTQSPALRPLSLPRSNPSHTGPSSTVLAPRTLSTYALIRNFLSSHLTPNKNRIYTVVIACFVVPILSVLVHIRRRRLKLSAASPVSTTSVVALNTAELVRRRLQQGGVESGWMANVARVLFDTVRMGGSGLV